jgi:hypothetical protein
MCLSTSVINLGEKIKEYQQDYFEHILRMSTYQIPWKILNYHHKGRRDRGQPLLRDGWINSPNREIINLVDDDDDDDDDDEQSWTEH